MTPNESPGSRTADVVDRSSLLEMKVRMEKSGDQIRSEEAMRAGRRDAVTLTTVARGIECE